jgi:hypothetical protein
MQLIIDHQRNTKQVDKYSIVLEAQTCQSLELLCSISPDNSIVVEEGAVGENYDDGKDQHVIDIINQYTQFDRVIFNNSNGRADKLLENCKHYNIKLPFYVISSCANYYKNYNNPQIVFFAEEEMIATHNPIIEQINPTHKFSCLNANKWSHRILTYIHLYDKPYFNDMIFGWGRRTGWTKDFLEQEDFINDIVVSDDEWAKLATLPQRILAHPDDDTDHNDRTTDHIAYTHACLNIITETTSRNDTPQLTEKSFKPILAGQFFIMISSRGLIQYMRDIGFDTFDDIINHSYDSIEDDRERISAAIKELDRLNEVDLFELHAQCKERFVKNQQWLKSPEFVEQFLPLTFKSY